MEIKPLLLLGYLNLMFFSKVVGTSIQFFEASNFTGLVHETNVNTEDCLNFANKEANSVRTDTCVIVYKHFNCQSWSSGKIIPGNSVWYGVKSYHKCNEKEGGSRLNVDFTTYFNPVDPVTLPKVVREFKDVCSCINIPRHVQQLEKWSINNHGNELLAYFEPDCFQNKFKPIFIKAGNTIFSTNMHMYERIDESTQRHYKIQSLGPDPNSTYFKTNCRIPLIVREKFQHFDEMLSNHQISIGDVKQKQSEDHKVFADYASSLQTQSSKLDSVSSEFKQLEQQLLESRGQRIKWHTKTESMIELLQEESTRISNEFYRLEEKQNRFEKQLVQYSADMNTKLLRVEEKISIFELKLDRCQKNVEYILHVNETPKTFETDLATWVKNDTIREG